MTLDNLHRRLQMVERKLKEKDEKDQIYVQASDEQGA